MLPASARIFRYWRALLTAAELVGFPKTYWVLEALEPPPPVPTTIASPMAAATPTATPHRPDRQTACCAGALTRGRSGRTAENSAGPGLLLLRLSRGRGCGLFGHCHRRNRGEGNEHGHRQREASLPG